MIPPNLLFPFNSVIYLSSLLCERDIKQPLFYLHVRFQVCLCKLIFQAQSQIALLSKPESHKVNYKLQG